MIPHWTSPLWPDEMVQAMKQKNQQPLSPEYPQFGELWVNNKNNRRCRILYKGDNTVVVEYAEGVEYTFTYQTFMKNYHKV
jgi:hypothetical protein